MKKVRKQIIDRTYQRLAGTRPGALPRVTLYLECGHVVERAGCQEPEGRWVQCFWCSCPQDAKRLRARKHNRPPRPSHFLSPK